MPRDVKTLLIDREVFLQTLHKKLADLPPLPAVVARIMHTVNDPNTSAEDLNRLISLDQALSSRVLRIVNSAYYGFPKRISTVTNAVVILGFNTVRNLVLGVSAFGMLAPKKGAGGLDRTVFWEHCVASAVAAGIVARRRRLKTRAAVEEAFLSGLLHDIGKLFLDCYFPVPYAVTLAYAERQEVTLTESELKVLGIDHGHVGRKIAEHWNFPSALVSCIGQHHAPVAGSELYDLVATVQVADWLAWDTGLGATAQGCHPELSAGVKEWLTFSEDDWAWAAQETQSQIDSARDMFELDRAA